MNNALYRVRLDGSEYACKLCVPDERRRAQREAGTLGWLDRHGVDLAPRLVGWDESLALAPYPAVAAEWIAGQPLESPWTSPKLAALLASVQLMHTCRPDRMQAQADLLPAYFHWFSPAPYLADLSGLSQRYLPWLAQQPPDGAQLAAQTQAMLAAAWPRLAQPAAEPLLADAPLCLVHVDPNPANALLGPDGRLRWVDWEYSGWGDPALDLIELVWHDGFYDLTREQRDWLVANYRPAQGDESFYDRLAYWEDLLAARWALLLLRSWWAALNGADRLRLGRIPMDPQRQRSRFLEMLARARRFYRI